jgi:hypothetical protein
MAKQPERIAVALEVGARRVFASALDWPGWARSGRDEATALQSLLDYGPRYKRAIAAARLGFRPPADLSQLMVAERLKGGAGTDFGAPGVAPAVDSQPVTADELRRLQSILGAGWKTFAATVEAARGRPLRTGPRGGGRDLAKLVAHVLESHAAYLHQISWKVKLDPASEAQSAIGRVATDTREALAAAATGKMPARGPRGGARWSARFFVRYAAWHLLDHVWEIEDRVQP